MIFYHCLIPPENPVRKSIQKTQLRLTISDWRLADPYTKEIWKAFCKFYQHDPSKSLFHFAESRSIHR